MSKLTNKKDLDAVDNFISDLTSDSAGYYVFAGSHAAWPDDNHPPVEDTSVAATELNLYNEVLFGKKILSENISQMIRRVDWVSDTVYDMYDDIDPSLLDKNFFVLTDDNRVYKCVFNNYGAASTYKPTTSSNEIFELADGYKWKYMYTLDNETSDYFVTDEFIPLGEDEDVKASAVPGTVDIVQITNDGYDYRTYHNGTLSYVGDRYVGLANTASQEDNFYNGCALYLVSGLGAGQLRKIVDYDGAQKTALIDTPFETFSILTIEEASGQIEVGYTIQQHYTRFDVVDKSGYFYKDGLAGALALVQQTDTLALGKVAYANDTSIMVQIVGSTEFALNDYPVINKDDGGSQIRGVVSTSSATGQYTANVTSGSVNIACNLASTFASSVNANNVLVDTYVSATGIASDTQIVSANNTHITLSKEPTASGTNVPITLSNKSLLFGIGDAGLPGLTGNTYFTHEITEKQYVRIGDENDKNVRKVVTIASDKILKVNTPFVNDPASGYVFRIEHAFTFPSYYSSSATGTITSINLEAMTISAENVFGTFLTGETIELIDSEGVSTGNTAVVSYISSLIDNKLSMVITQVTSQNAFYNYDLRIRGVSSQAVASFSSAKVLPSITYREVTGKIIQGMEFQSYVSDTSTIAVGSGKIIGKTMIPDNSTQYIVSPYVNIDGDGTGAMAYCVVNPSANTIQKIHVIDSGENYSFANVTISSNTLYGTTATARAIVSPRDGHGSNVARELDGRYVCIGADFRGATYESYKFPTYGSFRKIGLLKGPAYEDLVFIMNNPLKAEIVLDVTSGTVSSGDYMTANSVLCTVDSVNGSNVAVTVIAGSIYDIGESDDFKTYDTGAEGTISSVDPVFVANGDVIVQDVTGASATASIVNFGMGWNIEVTNVVGKFKADYVIRNSANTAASKLASIYPVSSDSDVTESYDLRFNQTVRVSLSANNKAFEVGGKVQQTITEATGIVYDTQNEIDLVLTGVSDTLTTGALLTDGTTGANGYILFANTSYAKLTSVQGSFGVSSTVSIPTGAYATVSDINNVLVLTSLKKTIQSGNTDVYLEQVKYANGAACSGVIGYHETANTITYPDLKTNTGDVVYVENLNPVTRTRNSKESLKLIIKM